ncbi:MAG: M1 family metallopeptidase, partial [Deltaproteobacteria bacterium]|nr:M1 family metallopeptidase [Deltaproteobacteria bacterium]
MGAWRGSHSGIGAARVMTCGLLAVALGCAAEAPPVSEPVAEPTQALRPDMRSTIPQEAHVVDYVIDARYDEAEHRIEGRTRITWRNRSPRAVERIPFHLYMNAFRAQDTAWMKQARGTHRAHGQDRDAPWGYLDVASVERLGGVQGTDGEPQRTGLTFAESHDPSLMDVTLDQPLAPGDAIELELSFETQLPKVFARTGFSDRFVLAGQWFPKPGVLHPDGRWQAHVFTLYSEFYADFGDYDVHLDLPGDLTVGASGIRVSRTEDGDRQRLHYRAESVHDFAWTAGPDLHESFAEHDGIRIRALLPTKLADQAGLHIDAQLAALDSMEERFGAYPWSTITFVVPPDNAKGAGGMEYPTFYTSTPALRLPSILDRLGFRQRVDGTFTTIHEFGHQYFQGLLASDEFTQPWLDEGLNTFSNVMVYVDRYEADTIDGPWVVTLGDHPLGIYDGLRYVTGRTPPIQAIDQPADHYDPAVGMYGSVVYRKTASTMVTLRKLVGAQAFDNAMGAYTRRYRFAHPTGDDLQRMLIEGIGARVTLGHTASGEPIDLDVAQFLDQALASTRTVDFRLHKVNNRARLGEAGWHRDEHGVLVGGDPPPKRGPEPSDEDLEAVVVVHRHGDFVVPVEIEVEFADDTRERVLWDGTGRYRLFRWPGRRVRWASIDPDRHLVLEGSRYDNTRYAWRELPDATVSASLAQLG